MHISSITDIINGKLLNTPCVSSVYGVKIDVKKVQEADLFFAHHEDEIPLAIQQGAYAIVCEKTLSISDNEIAWILVDSVSKSIIRYLRYKLSLQQLQAYTCSQVVFELLHVLKHNTKHQHIKLLSSNMQENFHLLQLVEQNDIIISDNTVLLQSLYPKYNPFLSVDYDIENLIIHSLFETSFSFKNHYFSHLRLSCLYIQEFLEVFIFLQQNVQLSLLKKAKLFKPLFIDKFYNTTEFGKSDRFLLIQENISLVQRELEYLKDYYKYAKLIVLAHQHANIQHLTNFNIIQVATSSDIFSHLKQNRFNAAYIIGFNTSDIETFFNSYDNTQALL